MLHIRKDIPDRFADHTWFNGDYAVRVWLLDNDDVYEEREYRPTTELHSARTFDANSEQASCWRSIIRKATVSNGIDLIDLLMSR